MTVNWGTRPGGNPATLGKDILYYIGDKIAHHPRSLQTTLGPSEVGTPCARKLAYKLLGVAEVNTGRVNWKATIGTAVHSWLEQALSASVADGRFLVECEVQVGEVAGIPIVGHADAYDMATDTVIDHKVVGPTQLLKYKANGPGEQYRTQAHLYGRGFQLAGRTPATVMIIFYPRNGELADSHVWFEPYDEAVALAGLARLAAIHTLVGIGGTAALSVLPTVEDYCATCPFHLPACTDLTLACPGHDSRGDTTQPNPKGPNV